MQYQFHIRGINAYVRHKKFMRDYGRKASSSASGARAKDEETFEEFLEDRARKEKVREMASVSMMASFISGAAAVAQPMNNRRTLVVAKAAARADGQDVATVNKEEKGSNRRAAMVAVAAAAVTAVAGSAFAADEPKRGSPEAKKKYAPICVTMPTARVCHSVA